MAFPPVITQATHQPDILSNSADLEFLECGKDRAGKQGHSHYLEKCDW